MSSQSSLNPGASVKRTHSYLANESIRRKFNQSYQCSTTNTQTNFVKNLVKNLEQKITPNKQNKTQQVMDVESESESSSEDDLDDFSLLNDSELHTIDANGRPVKPVTTCLPTPASHFQFDSNNNGNKSGNAKPSLKSRLGSIMGWKPSKTLPKGTREYYSARQSLGEEMRQFRKKEMPKMKHRYLKGPDSPKLINFQEIIGIESNEEEDHCEEAQKSIQKEDYATIHRRHNSGLSRMDVTVGNDFLEPEKIEVCLFQILQI